MTIDANRLANQVKLAYEFMEALHGQGLALIKDVETQLAQAPEELQCLRPGGYRFAVNELSLTLERPQAAIAEFYAVCFRHFAGRAKTTPLDGDVPPIVFLKIVFRERKLEHPEVRFGVFTDVEKPVERGHQWPNKFEDVVNHVTRREIVGQVWSGLDTLRELYEDSYIRFTIEGRGIRLSDLPDSEAIAERIVEPLLAMYRKVA